MAINKSKETIKKYMEKTPLFNRRTRKKTGDHNLCSKNYSQMVAEAAYFIAEKRNFQTSDPLADWVEAEQQISKTYPLQS